VIIIVCVVAVLLLIIILVGFFVVKGFMGGVDEAKAVADMHYSYLIAKDYDSDLNLYHEKFFEVTSKEETKNILLNLSSQLGDVISYKLYDFNMYTSIGAGTTVTLTYLVDRTKFDSKESIGFLKEKGEERYSIISFNINSEGFLGSFE